MLLAGTLCFRAEGAAGNVDLSFDPGSGVNGAVNAVALQPDGKVIIGGEFTTVRGLARSRVARLNPDGSGDVSFNVNIPDDQWGSVYALAMQPDGKVLIGGDFTIIDGAARPHVARLYGDPVILPPLSIERSGAFAILSWPVTALNFQLQETTDLSLPNSWSRVAEIAVTNVDQISVTVPATAPRKFFRLKSQ